jgi:hypothetical protein
MPTCARAVQQADGSLALVLDPSASDVTACSYVVQTGPEVANSLVALSAEDGAEISGMIVALWAAAWGIRAVINVVQNSGASDEKL